MIKMKVALLGVLALFITSGIMTSVASANGPAWKVNGTRLGSQVKKQIKLLAGATELKGKVTLLAVTIRCGTAKAEGAYIEGAGQSAGRDGAAAIVFSQCEVVAPKQCKVVEPIRTASIKSQLVTLANGQQIDDLIEPSQGTTFAKISFESKPGEKCPITEPIIVKGSVAALVKPEDTETVTGGELEFPEKAITEIKKEGAAAEKIGLLIGTEASVFSGKFGTRLETGESFGAFH